MPSIGLYAAMHYALHLHQPELACRIASGLPLWAAARGSDVPVEEVEALMEETSFREQIGSWSEILRLDPDARKQRLLALANDIIDAALARGDRRAILFVQRQSRRRARRSVPPRCRRRAPHAAPAAGAPTNAAVQSSSGSSLEPLHGDAATARVAPSEATHIPIVAAATDGAAPQRSAGHAGRSALRRPAGGTDRHTTTAPKPIAEDRLAIDASLRAAHHQPAISPTAPIPTTTDHTTIKENLAAALRRETIQQARQRRRWPGGM